MKYCNYSHCSLYYPTEEPPTDHVEDIKKLENVPVINTIKIITRKEYMLKCTLYKCLSKNVFHIKRNDCTCSIVVILLDNLFKFLKLILLYKTE